MECTQLFIWNYILNIDNIDLKNQESLENKVENMYYKFLPTEIIGKLQLCDC